MELPLQQLIGSFLSVSLGLTLCLVSTILGAIIYRRFLHPLSGIPGPFLASITDLWRLYFTFCGGKSWEQVEISLHQKYGPLVRIAPNVISIADAGCVNPIYGHKSRFVKSNWYHPHGNQDNKNLFNETDPQLHAEKRRKVASLYSMSAIHQMEHRVDEVCSTFQKKLYKFASSGQPLDLGLWVQMYAFDVIGEITYGKTFGLLEDEGDKNNYIQAVGSSFPVLVSAGFFPFLLSLMRFSIFWSFVPGGQEISQDSSRLFQLVDSSVHERLQRPKSWKRDMLGQLLEAQENGKRDITLSDILMLGGGNIGAGSDTTAIALRAIFYFLLKNPHCYQKLQAEVDEADKEGKLSPFVTFTEANSLPYLCAVVMEATRLHPSVGYLLERVVPEEGSQLSGTFFKQGTIVGMNPFVVHRDTRIFGSDAAEFVPERWLNVENAKVMSRYLLTFGYGSRSCIGKNISLMEMHKLIPQLMRNFEFSLVNPQREWTVKTFWFSFQKDVLVYVKGRNRDSVN